MSAFFHALNIGTLATWLSVASFGTVGIAVHGGSRVPAEKPKDPYDRLETVELSADFMPDAGDPPPAAPGEESATEPETAQPEELPLPPEMPELAETTPLPEIPDLPEPPAKESSFATAPVPEPRRAPKKESRPAPRVRKAASASGSPAQGKPGGTGNAATGSASSDGNRLAGGRMPAPSYPSEARAAGQSGTVVVEFIVGEGGNVISAYAKSPSPWPLLNERAVSAVLRWKFKPGPVAKFSRPIVFKLN